MLLKVTHHCQTKQHCLIGFSRPFLLSFIICIVLFPLVFFKKLRNQARNQEFFRPGKFSWNQGTSINIHLQHEKKGPPGGNFPFFPLETLKNFILNEKFHLTDDHNQYISSANQDTFFQFSKKGLGRPPSPPPFPFQLRTCEILGMVINHRNWSFFQLPLSYLFF